jgi:hypothetical protein
MPFSFNPNQEQGSAAPVPQQSNNGVPLLNVPVAPVITLTPVAEVISPFAYKNRNKSKFNVYFQLVIFLIFGCVAVASIGLVMYQNTLKIQISNRKETLDGLQASFKKVPTDDMVKLSSRLGLINKIINERVSVRAAFTILEESINPSVIYDTFSLSKSKKNDFYDISFGGRTNSYTSLYQQIEILKSKQFAGVFKKMDITGIGPLDKKGLTNFKAAGSLSIAGVDPDTFTLINKSTTTQTTSIQVDTSLNTGSTTTITSAQNTASSSSNIKR